MRIIGRLILLASLATGLLAGCEPAVPRDELGEVEYKVPAVPGSEEPYKLPDGGKKTVSREPLGIPTFSHP